MITFHERGWVHDGSEWYPDHDTHLTEVWAPSALPQELRGNLCELYRFVQEMGPLEGMMGARWNPDVGEWEWPEDLTA